MSHWAEIDSSNIVVRVLVGDNNDPNGDEGYLWLINNLGGNWVKTSYNSFGGKRKNPENGEMTQDLGFRKNYAGVGFMYDSEMDAFIPPKPFASWRLNEDTCLWNPPVEYPEDGKSYYWNEDSLIWVEFNE